MNLTPAQLQALKTDLAANTAAVTVGGASVAINAIPVGQRGPDAAFAVADWYNATAAPDYHVYRTAVPQSEIMLNGFDWTRVDNLSVGKARIWEWMFAATVGRTIDPSKPNVRAGINAAWVGTAADLAVRAAVYAHCYRPATRAEKLFAGGAGTAPDGSGTGPATMGAEGTMTYQDVLSAWELP